MIPTLANHLWQSTVFALGAGLLTLVFRRNRAQARYAIWLAASLKFLIPFSLLVTAGTHLQWSRPSATPPRLSIAMDAISQPFQPPPPLRAAPGGVETSGTLVPWVLLTVWLCGFAGLLLFWGLRWRRLQLAAREASSIDLGAPILTLSSSACIEPGIFGVFRPALLLPEGIADRLTKEQLAAIVAHELCHVRRRDNLAAAIHMVVEAVFWFHPLVWWIGARLVEERERACDEEVLRMGSEPQAYAEGILNVCKFYVESPLACVSGVTGSNLKKRIEEIMTHQIARKIDFGRKLLLTAAAFAAIAAPVAIGIMETRQLRAQQQAAAPIPFEVASVKSNKSTDRPQLQALPGGTLTIKNAALNIVVMVSYGLQPNFNAAERVSGMPKWAESERFDIEAKAAPGVMPAGLSQKQTNDKSMLVLQSVLADRFKMTTHWETRQEPVYSLTVARNGLKLPKAKIEEKDCPAVPTRTEYCHRFNGGQGQGLHGKTITMTDLVDGLQGWTDHPVIDNTGVQGLFDIDTEGWVPMRPRLIPPGERTESQAAEDRAFADPARPTLQQVLDKVGLKLESAKGPVQILVVDHIERPSEN
jgi:bla regulator protein BlaR1